MHIAVSAEARSRANREFRAIATSNPFIPLHPPLPAVSPPPSSFRSSRFQFRPDPAEYISLPPAPNPPLLSLSSGLFAPLPSSFPASALVHPRVLFPSFFFLFFFLLLSFVSTRRQTTITRRDQLFSRISPYNNYKTGKLPRFHYRAGFNLIRVFKCTGVSIETSLVLSVFSFFFFFFFLIA